MLMRKLVGCIVAGILALTIASFLVPGFTVEGELNQSIKILVLAGVVLGLINCFIKPVINLITLPLRWLTFGLFSLVINILIIWLIDVIFSPQITIAGFKALFLSGLLVWLANLLVPKKERRKRSYNN